MNILPATRLHRVSLAVFLALWIVTCIRSPYPDYLVLQHIPTVAAMIALAVAERRMGVSPASYGLLLAFLSLHVVGARYIYSEVPYDAWCEMLLGVNMTDRFDLTRNHYDRIVHLAYGLLVSVVAYRFSRRVLKLSAIWSYVVAVQFIMASGAFYELAEWSVAMVLAPDWVDAYNGQQGDRWDPQRDMVLAALGAVASMMVVAVVNVRRIRRGKRSG